MSTLMSTKEFTETFKQTPSPIANEGTSDKRENTHAEITQITAASSHAAYDGEQQLNNSALDPTIYQSY